MANSICADVSETEFRVLIKLDVAQDEEDEEDEEFEGRTLRLPSRAMSTADSLQHPSSSTSSTHQTTPTKPPDST
jgi:hypothetical protein